MRKTQIVSPRKHSVFGGLASPARYGIAYDLKDKEAMPGSRLAPPIRTAFESARKRAKKG